ncbi:MAG: hypothetical protein Q8K78_14130 [Planctomycetaceae bacterium]|nr:hypothetical protein [Planctomycetaceae bacterium]
MPRRRKQTTIPVETSVSTETPTDVRDTVPEASPATAGSPPVEAPIPSSASTGDEPAAAELVTATTEGPSSPEPRGRFRSWVTEVSRGYHRLIDEQENRLVLLFDAKPAADVLTAIKGAGFQYHPDYAGVKQAWVRRNDFEGRLQVEAIEKLIGTTPQRASAAR